MSAPPDRAHLRRVRSDRRRRPAGRPAHAREHGLPSAVGRHRAHGAGHARRRVARRGRRGAGAHAGERAARGHARRRVQDRRARLSPKRARGRRDPRRAPRVPLVLDPVLASGRGDALATEETIAALRELIVPQTHRRDAEQHRSAAPRERDVARAVGAAPGRARRRVRARHRHARARQRGRQHAVRPRRRRARRPLAAAAGSYHGSGCTLASAIAATLANGLGVPEAVRDAQEFTWQALPQAFRAGTGQLLPDRFFWARETLAGK